MKIKNLYLLMLVAACMTAMTATASVNKFIIDNLQLTPNDLGTRITIPVKASFETPVSTWDVKFVLPYGLSLVNISRGSDMQINYIDSNGREKICNAAWEANKESAHVIGSTFGNCVYDEDYYVDYQIKWGAGTYDEMLVLTVSVGDDFSGGNIEIISETACGYDSDPTGLIPDTLYTWQNEEEFYYKGDVDMDGSINVNDVTVIIYVMLNEVGSEYQYMVTRSDINFDGIVDICDVVELLDFLIHWDQPHSWYTGYEKNVCTTTTEVRIPIEYPFSNQFFIEEFEISPNDLGQNITIPVKANFEGYVSSWDVEFEFPEGLTPIAFSPGSDMTVNYCDHQGHQKSERAWSVHNNDLTHFVATIININYIPTEDEEYEMSGSVKWEPGSYEDMFLLTVHVDDTFQEGIINVHSKTTCGYDLRFDTLCYPTTMEYPGEDQGWPGDVNGDGIDDVNDVVGFMNYFVDPTNDPYFELSSADIHIDGLIDLLDMEKLIDYILWGAWYEGYMLNTAETTCYCNATMPNIPGDMDGNYILDVDDITSIIDLVLNGGSFSTVADVNNDGLVDIDDVTTLINMILNGH